MMDLQLIIDITAGVIFLWKYFFLIFIDPCNNVNKIGDEAGNQTLQDGRVSPHDILLSYLRIVELIDNCLDNLLESKFKTIT